MQSEKKHANIDKQGGTKARILEYMLKVIEKEYKPVPKDELKAELGLTKENLKFHLHDSVSGLCPDIITERQRKLYLKFKNLDALKRAVSYLATDPWVERSIKSWFVNAFMSEYGDIFTIGPSVISFLSDEEYKQYQDYQERYNRSMGKKERPILTKQDFDLAMKILDIERGKTEKDVDFMFVYEAMLPTATKEPGSIAPPDRVKISDYSIGNFTNAHIERLAAVRIKKLPLFFEERLSVLMHGVRLSRRAASWETFVITPDLPPVSENDGLMFLYYTTVLRKLKQMSIEELGRLIIPLNDLIDSNIEGTLAKIGEKEGHHVVLRIDRKTLDYVIKEVPLTAPPRSPQIATESKPRKRRLNPFKNRNMETMSND